MEYTDIASYFYTLWISHYIIKVVKNPISKHRRSIIFYHISTNTFSLACTLYLLFTRSYGVSVSFTCSITVIKGNINVRNRTHKGHP